MSRLLGIGNKSFNTYKQLKQTPSDDEIESSGEECAVFLNDKSTVQLQLVPNGTEHQRKLTKKFVKAKNWKQCLILLAVIVVSVCGLVLGIVLVRTILSRTDTLKKVASNSTQSETKSQNPMTEVPQEDIETKYKEDVNLTSEETIKWKKTWQDLSGESCIRLLDVDGDGKEDVLFGVASSRETAGLSYAKHGKYGDLIDWCQSLGREYPCVGYVLALRGYDGHLLWNISVRSEVFLMNCENFDIDMDGRPDCIGTGRQAVVVAFNPYLGHERVYWSLEDDNVLEAAWNTYQASPLPDWNQDGVPEVLIANGGDPDELPDDFDRKPGRLVVLCGKTGKMVGTRYLEMPNKRETYMTPVLYHPADGSDVILFGSGGETISGDLMGISLVDLCHYIYGETEAADKCLPRETETVWPNIQKDENGVFIIVRGVNKGVMVPPVIIDVNKDSVSDILITLYEGGMILKDGRDLSDMWTSWFASAETYSTPAPGYFDDDDVIDFMVHWSSGAWPWFSSSNVTAISGKDGSVLWTLNSTHYEMTSDLVIQTDEPHRDLFLFKLKGLGSPYKRAGKGVLVREGEETREKRHGTEDLPPSGGIPPGEAVDKSYMMNDYSKYHITCDEDLSKHRGEMFLVDRSSMKHPLKILDIPLQKYVYDAPVVEPPKFEAIPDPNSNHSNQSLPTSHMGVQLPYLNGNSGDPRDNITEFKKMCILLDSDDRSTGAVGDLDGDGVMEYISIYTMTGQTIDTMYGFYDMVYTMNINVVSLKLLSNQIKSVSVPPKSSFSSFTPKQSLKNIRTLHTMPYSDQKWTQYLGKHGNGHYDHQN